MNAMQYIQDESSEQDLPYSDNIQPAGYFNKFDSYVSICKISGNQYFTNIKLWKQVNCPY